MTPPTRKPVDFAAVDWSDIRRQAEALGADGCSGPTLPIYVSCCLRHDIAYITHCDEHGAPITRLEADVEFRECHHWFSPLGEASPIAAWRYAAVRVFGWWYWYSRKPATPIKAWLAPSAKGDAMQEQRQIPEWVRDAVTKAAEKHAPTTRQPWWKWARRLVELILNRAGTPR